MAKEDDISLIAYGLWEQEGCPNGKDWEHWYKAELIWEKLGKTDIQQIDHKTEKATSKRKKSYFRFNE